MTVDDVQREQQASLFSKIRNALKSPFKSTKRKRSDVGDTDSDSDFNQHSVKRTQTRAEVRDLGITSSDSDVSFDAEINLKQKSNVPLDSFAKIGIVVDVNYENSWHEGEIVRLELKEGSDEVFLYIIRIEKGELKGKEVSIEKKSKSRSLRHVDCIEKELLESGRPGEFELWKLLKSRITLNQRKAFVEWYSGENEKFSFDKFLKFQVPGGENFLTMILCQNGNIDEKVVGTTSDFEPAVDLSGDMIDSDIESEPEHYADDNVENSDFEIYEDIEDGIVAFGGGTDDYEFTDSISL